MRLEPRTVAGVTQLFATQRVIVAGPAVSALAILAIMLFGWVQAQRSAELLLRGEADLAIERVNQPLRSVGVFPNAQRLAETLASMSSQGLRYLAVVGDGDVLVASGPAPPGVSQALALAPRDPRRIGALAWVRSHPLPPAAPFTRADAAPLNAAPHDAPALLLAFEPMLVQRLDRTATLTLVAGVAAALGLLVLSMFARRLLTARDDALEELEHERVLAKLGTMSSVVAHELRNPLASLKGHAQLLVEGLTSVTHKAQAQHIVDAAWRLQHLSDSLLELARTGAVSAVDVVPRDVAIGALSRFDAARVHLDASGAPASWRLDPTRFESVLTNLVDNALHASTVDAPVQVRVTHEAGALVIDVRDFGPGVEPSERERIFEPFVTTRAQGVGLGLALARQIVALHGGSLRVVDVDGAGACFRVVLPANVSRKRIA